MKSPPDFIKILSSYSNIYLRNINTSKIFDGTPGEDLEKKKNIYDSKFPAVHLSDALRLLMLYKFGGIYLDLDVIVLKSFDELAPTFVTNEKSGFFSNGALGFSNIGFGHHLIQLLLR